MVRVDAPIGQSPGLALHSMGLGIFLVDSRYSITTIEEVIVVNASGRHLLKVL